MAGPLSDAVLLRVPDTIRTELEETADLEKTLEAIVHAARTAWPDLELDAQVFVGYMADRLAPDADASALAEIRAADLYLACACALNIEGAIAAFERDIFPQLIKALGHLDRTGVLIEDVKQGLRSKLFAAQQGELGKIADFAGRSKLWRWVRVAATRLAIDLASKDKFDKRLGEDALPEPSGDLQLDLLKAKYSGEFREAFEKAVADLDHRERSLLRMSYIDRTSIDELGALHQVHRATAARWLQQARERLAHLTKEHLRLNLKTSEEEVDSIMRLIRSRMDVSVKRLLKDS